MKKLILSFFVLIPILSFSQEKYLFAKTDLKDIRNSETVLKSKSTGFQKMGVSEDFFAGAIKGKDYYPLTFSRTNDNFYPNLNVEYFYNESDSVINCAVYNWDIMRYVKNLFTDGHLIEPQKKRKKEYLNKYLTLKQQMIDKLGQPTLVEEPNDSNGLFYKTNWVTEDLEVTLFLGFSKKLKDIMGVKMGTFRVRLKIEYK